MKAQNRVSEARGDKQVQECHTNKAIYVPDLEDEANGYQLISGPIQDLQAVPKGLPALKLVGCNNEVQCQRKAIPRSL